MLFKNIEKRKD
jgi:hypothetical protein